MAILISLGCDKNSGDPDERPPDGEDISDSLKILPEGSQAYLISVNPTVKYQTIDNFGASDSWSAFSGP